MFVLFHFYRSGLLPLVPQILVHLVSACVLILSPYESGVSELQESLCEKRKRLCGEARCGEVIVTYATRQLLLHVNGKRITTGNWNKGLTAADARIE